MILNVVQHNHMTALCNTYLTPTNSTRNLKCFTVYNLKHIVDHLRNIYREKATHTYFTHSQTKNG